MKVSIITINFNNLEGLKKTVKSVICQTYHDIEYIIIDGASTDGSADYVKENKEYFNYWVSEPDKGIYNAMNKGIDYATGDYLLFLNSGDYLVDENVIEKFVGFNPVEDIVYGDVVRIFGDGKDIRSISPEIITIEDSLHTSIVHQAIFFNKGIFENNYYDESYKIVADWVVYIKSILIQNKTYRKIDLIISYFDATGFSSDESNKDEMFEERKRFIIDSFGITFYNLYKEYRIVSNRYNGLKNSGSVILALKISNLLKKIIPLKR